MMNILIFLASYKEGLLGELLSKLKSIKNELHVRSHDNPVRNSIGMLYIIYMTRH